MLATVVLVCYVDLMKYEILLFERGDSPSDVKVTVLCANEQRLTRKMVLLK